MNNRIRYKCLECGYEDVSVNKDGRNCCKCGGRLIPKGYADKCTAPSTQTNVLFSITQHEADLIIYNLLQERYDYLLHNSSRDGRMWDKVCYLVNVYKGKVDATD